MGLKNKSGDSVSLALSVLRDMPSGATFAPGRTFYVRNNNEDTVEVELVPLGQEESVHVNIGACTELPVLVKKVINAPEGLQWGY